MTTLVEHSELSVTVNKGKEQVWVGRYLLLQRIGFSCKSKYRITHCDNGDAVLDLVDSDTNRKDVKGKVFDREYTVTGKAGKPFIDLKNLPDTIKKAKSVRVIYLKHRVIITVHSSEIMMKEREADLIKTLDDGKRVKVASIFSSDKMKEQLKRSGLNELANDLSCQLAIEIEKSALDAALLKTPEHWQTKSKAAYGDLTEIDFSQTPLPSVNGLIVDASVFDIRTDKKAGKKRTLSADSDHTEIGAIMMTVIEVLKRTNPAFINIEIQLPDQSRPKKEYSEQQTAYNTIMTVFSSVINSLGYNINQDVFEEDGRNLLSLLAISKNLEIDQINKSSLVCEVTQESVKAIEPEVIAADLLIEQNREIREQFVKQRVLGELPLLLSSVFSGGGILDRSVHDGLADMKLNAFCKFGMEWIEKYYLSNLENNHQLWSDESFFLLGDVRHVNVYERKLCNVNGIFLGIPCIGASRSGLVKNNITCAEEHEIAGALFVSAIEIIKAANPAFIVIENVPEYQNTVSMSIIRSVLNVLGFNITEDVLAGNDYGALENRKRLVVVATSKGLGDNVLLDCVPSIVEKQNALNDVIDVTPPSDSSWSWRDYLDAKAIKDKAKGNNFDQQKLTGAEPKCGVLGRSYQKGRSTEPFLIFPEQEYYATLLDSMQQGVSCEHVKQAFKSLDHVGMYTHNANNVIAKLNKRLNLKGGDRKQSVMSAFLQSQCNSNASLSDIHAAFMLKIEDKDFLEEFIATTDAISKATRLLNPNEHARVKRVPEFLISGLPATTAHEILGNGVIYSLFKAIGRRLGAWLWEVSTRGRCFLVELDKLSDVDGADIRNHPDGNMLVEIKNDYEQTYQVVKNAGGTAYLVPIAASSMSEKLASTNVATDDDKLLSAA